MRILRARLLARPGRRADAAAADARRSQVRTVDRSERVRTYNFPENRIADHRVGYKAYNLDAVLDGDLDAVLDALAQADPDALLGGRPWPEIAAVGDPGGDAGLDAAGVPSPGVDAEELAAHLLGVSRTRLGADRRWSTSRVDALRGAGRPARGPDPAAAPVGVAGVRPRWTSRSDPGCSSRGRRPRCWSMGGRGDRRRPEPGRRRPVHRERRDRAGDRRRGGRTRG